MFETVLESISTNIEIFPVSFYHNVLFWIHVMYFQIGGLEIQRTVVHALHRAYIPRTPVGPRNCGSYQAFYTMFWGFFPLYLKNFKAFLWHSRSASITTFAGWGHYYAKAGPLEHKHYHRQGGPANKGASLWWAKAGCMSPQGMEQGGVRDFITLFRMVHNVKLGICLLLKFSI